MVIDDGDHRHARNHVIWAVAANGTAVSVNRIGTFRSDYEYEYDF